MRNYKENIRYIARFVVETATPMAIGSGEKGLTVDRLIVRDANNLPYIPGTSMAGVVRHELDEVLLENEVNDIFGYQGKGNDGQGSRINFSSAILVAADGKQTVLEGLNNVDFTEGYYSYFNRLPERDHVRITHRGTADTKGHGKFDEELVHKGTRFVFEIELEGTEADKKNWNSILEILHNPSFRIGAGTRKGFGALKIVECKTISFDLKKDIVDYLNVASSLNKSVKKWKSFTDSAGFDSDRFYKYMLNIKPENFYIFGAGIGDEDVDMAPKTERHFDWSNGKPVLSEKKILIPGTSIKGALSHRVAFHYNDLSDITVDNNSAEFSTINENELIESLSELKALQEKVATYSSTKVDIENKDLDQLKALKKALEDKKAEVVNFAAELKEIEAKKLVSDSTKWSKYEQDLEDEKKQFSEFNPNVAELNEGVKQLFGFAKNTKNSDSPTSEGLRGRVIISDVYLDEKHANVTKKVFDHVAIDRFTGGGIDGALYQEKAISSNGFMMDIYVEKKAFETGNVKEAFEKSLDDLVRGNIQLGGNTGKGHGAFVGEYELINE